MERVARPMQFVGEAEARDLGPEGAREKVEVREEGTTGPGRVV